MTDQQIELIARKEAHEIDILIDTAKAFEIEEILTKELSRFIRVIKAQKD